MSTDISFYRAMNRDPEIYGLDADKFNPSRHLDENGQLKPAPADTKEESHVTYGFGKRLVTIYSQVVKRYY